MAGRLDSELLLQSDIYNLAFAGGSALTGLMLLKENALLSGYVPESIWIEENILLIRGADYEMIGSLFHPVGYALKKHIPSLREKYQPLNFVMSALKTRFGKSKDEQASQQRDERIYAMSIQNQLASYQNPIQGYEANLALLEGLLAFFEQRGVRIVFFQMPFDPVLAPTPRVESQHEILRHHFGQYEFLPAPNHQAYMTNDGIHLMPESAMRFSKEFVEITHKSYTGKNDKWHLCEK